MARTRLLKPGFFTNDHLAALPMAARLLFQGLWCIADREGRLEDRPARIKVEVLPYDDEDIDGLLNQLWSAGYIVRYAVGESSVIQIQNFAKHQHPHHKESASPYPAPTLPQTSPEIAPDKPHTSPSDTLTLNQIPPPDAEALPVLPLTKMTVAYDGLMGRLASSPPIQQEMADWLDDAPPGYDAVTLFEEACREAALHDGRSLKYVLKILERWAREGKEDRRPKATQGGAATPEMQVILGGVAVKTFEQELADQRRARNGA